MLSVQCVRGCGLILGFLVCLEMQLVVKQIFCLYFENGILHSVDQISLLIIMVSGRLARLIYRQKLSLHKQSKNQLN